MSNTGIEHQEGIVDKNSILNTGQAPISISASEIPEFDISGESLSPTLKHFFDFVRRYRDGYAMIMMFDGYDGNSPRQKLIFELFDRLSFGNIGEETRAQLIEKGRKCGISKEEILEAFQVSR